MKEERICKTCAHYRRHYIIDKERCTAVNCGHCVCIRIKKRRPDDRACEHYIFRDNDAEIPDREEVISYLTTDFLKGILEKALPPYVEMDAGEETG